MITAYAMLRLLVLARRIARALESIAESQSTLARAATESIRQPHSRPLPTVLSRMDPRAAEERERRRRVESGEAIAEEYRHRGEAL